MKLIMTGAAPEEIWPLIRDFHYSKRMPGNIQHCYVARMPGGLLGDTGTPVAAAVFSSPPTRWSESVIELTRLVRTDAIDIQLTGLISFALKWLRRHGHDLVVSFADETQNHFGGIYQAASWNYHDCRAPQNDGVVIDGLFIPGRTLNSRYGTRSPNKLKALLPDSEVEAHFDQGKHLYWKAIKRVGHRKARLLGLQTNPYPKPYAARHKDDSRPRDASQVQLLGAAPSINVCDPRTVG